MNLKARVEIKTTFRMMDANKRFIGDFISCGDWCGISKLVCEAGPLKGEEILVMTPDPARPGEPLEIVKASPNAVDAIMAYSPAG